MSKKVLLTGDRPTGPLHIGHYFGSLKERVLLQDTCETYIMIADAQALTDNYKEIDKVRNNILEVVADYLAVGIDPYHAAIFIQSCVKELPELAMYLLNLVSIQRIGHNPTVKAECKMRGFEESVPAGFYLYPLFQVSDITAFKANFVPVGLDQAPMLELTRDLVRRFNEIYHTEALIAPEAIYPKEDKTLPGIDAQKMSKSLGNAIYLSDTSDEIRKKISKMKSDPSRTSISDPGDPEKAIAFTYLDIFDPEKEKVNELKEQYKRGGLGDKVIKERLIEVLTTFIEPIRKRREMFAEDKSYLYEVLKTGTNKAREKAASTLSEVRTAMGIQYPFLM